jgi:hypothetical protein
MHALGGLLISGPRLEPEANVNPFDHESLSLELNFASGLRRESIV